MQSIAENLWILRYPLSLLGIEIGRTVTVIRLRSGEIVIHSTGPFTTKDAADMHALGRPAWLLEATLFHDTFAQAGRATFSSLPYFAPEGFSRTAGATESFRSIPPAWDDEVRVLELKGMPAVREHVFLHQPTRTLVVADLVFNFGAESSVWARRFFQYAGGVRKFPGTSRLFRFFIRDRVAFRESVNELLRWDFDRLIVGHGDVVQTGAKEKLRAALADYA